MRRLKTLVTCLLIAVIAVGATFASVKIAVPGVGFARSADPAAAIHRSYRESSDIVLATCTGVYRSAAGAQQSLYRIDTVYAGSIAAGSSVSLEGRAEVGQSYLLYLGEGGGADYSEAEAGYVCVTEEPIAVRQGIASIGGVNYALSDILDDLEKQRSVLAIPAQSFYYTDLDQLISACDEIVIGRVTGVTGPVATPCRSDEKGESVISTTEQTFVSVQVVNGLGGRHSYGDMLRVALSAVHSSSVINATDLTPVSFGTPVTMPQEGGYYIFLLLRSADSKSDCLFAVNPYQGYVSIEGDDISHPYYNTAFDGVTDLNEFARILSDKQGF